ncbi:RNase P subunit p30-domain-containing protein [Kockovaella imperatae]|uniref:RNase P subunit p30-domain-containing protein n=1 Tax=Kockovaella imperatae TaxID=4999 RepID=A0A1Y1UP88_9TREE|nr:RNase P subunit p30-domain-containing protein [Kockovaella imperatae]ORX39848.1 RNase P subunit p30-domain-containing protein [Kockovaella imperatae]
MYFDLYLPFPIPRSNDIPKKKKDKSKGKGKAEDSSAAESVPQSCWAGLEEGEREGFARSMALSGHLGYSIVGCTVNPSTSALAHVSPFLRALPYPQLDPRSREDGKSGQSSNQGLTMVQVSRLHLHLDDSRTHCLTGANSAVLKEYDIISVQPLTEKAFQLVCTDLCLPGPNQVSIITLPLHERPYHFRLNRKQVRQAQRNGVMFEILYSAALSPSSASRETARRYRQNFLSNAKELVRITGGKGIILSSGPGGGDDSMRGPLDLVNLGTMLGMPANLAKDAVSANPKRVLLNAQARRTFKGVMTMPKMVDPPEPSAALVEAEGRAKRQSDTGQLQEAKRVKIA